MVPGLGDGAGGEEGGGVTVWGDINGSYGMDG